MMIIDNFDGSGYEDEFDEDDLLAEGQPLVLKVPGRGQVMFLLVASVADDTDWEDIEGIMYELGGEFMHDSREIRDGTHGRVVVQPTEQGLFAVVHHSDSYELYLSSSDDEE